MDRASEKAERLVRLGSRRYLRLRDRRASRDCRSQLRNLWAALRSANGLQLLQVSLGTSSRAKLDHGFYVYKDAKGELRKIPAGRVREMEPASMAESEKDQFKISTQKK